MRRLVEWILAHVPWYDPMTVEARQRRTVQARRDATATRRALAEVRRLETVARRRPCPR